MAATAFALATLCNPYGLRLHALVLSYLTGAGDPMPVVHAHVREFAWIGRALAQGTLDPVRFVGLVAVTALAAWTTTRPALRYRGLTVLALAAMAVAQVRHLELAGLVGVVVLAPAMDAVIDRRPAFDIIGISALERAVPWTLAAALAIAVVGHAAVLSARSPDDWVTDELGGSELPGLIDALPAHTRLHTSFVQTGVAIWFGAPRDVRVLYDLRNDCYSRATGLDAVILEKAPAGSADALEVLARRRVEAVIVPVEHPLARTLAHARGWERHQTRLEAVYLFGTAPRPSASVE